MILFYLLIAIMPLVRHSLWSETSVVDLTLNKLLGLLCLTVALAHWLRSRSSVHLFQTAQARLFVLFAFITIGSFLVRGPALSPEDSPLAAFVSFLLLLFMTLVLVDSLDRLRWVLLSAIGGLAFVSLHAIREWQGGGMLAGDRPGWVAGDPNYLALSLLLGFPLAFLQTLRPNPRWERLFYLGSLLIMLLAFILAASRGGFVGLLAILLMLAWRSHNRLRYLAVGGVLFGVILVAAPTSPLTRFLEPATGDVVSDLARAALLRAGFQMFLDHVWFGVGVGNFKPLVGPYSPPDLPLANVAHNTYLEVAAEQGLFGLITFLALLYCTLRSLRQTRRSTQAFNFILFTTANGVEIGILGAAVADLFLSALHVRLFWFMVILSTVLASIPSDPFLARQSPAERPEVLHA